MSDPDFDWNDGDVVIPNQQPIAVYTNGDGDIVIRQDGDWYRKEDPWIVIRPENARRLVEAILALSLAEPEQASRLALPAPLTAAERQRKRRDKQRDSVTTQRDTERDSRDSANLFEETPAKVVEAGP